MIQKCLECTSFSGNVLGLYLTHVVHMNYYHYTHLTASFPGQLAKPVQQRKNQPGFKWGKKWWNFGMQWHQLDDMQTVCTSLQTDNHTTTSSLNFYKPDALRDAQPAVSKHSWHVRMMFTWTTTVLHPLYSTTRINQHPQLRSWILLGQCFTYCMLLLMVVNTFSLWGRS